jgi:sterol 3beta-glucosyltransferase
VDVGVDVEALMHSDSGKEWIENRSTSPFQEARNMKRMLGEHSDAMRNELLRICQEPDVLISNLPTFGIVQAIAENFGKKHIRMMLAPLTPSADPDFTMVPIVPQGENFLNRFAGYIGIYSIYWILKDSTNSFRQQLRLHPWGYGDFARAWNQMPVLYGVSPQVMPHDPKWNEDIFVTGFWFDALEPATTEGKQGNNSAAQRVVNV